MTASGGDTLWMMPTDQQGLPSGTDIRARILDATEQIMLEEGYAGVSSGNYILDKA
jgi:hypothetical protein